SPSFPSPRRAPERPRTRTPRFSWQAPAIHDRSPPEPLTRERARDSGDPRPRDDRGDLDAPRPRRRRRRPSVAAAGRPHRDVAVSPRLGTAPGAAAGTGRLRTLPRRRRRTDRPRLSDPLPGAGDVHRRGDGGALGPRKPDGAAPDRPRRRQGRRPSGDAGG